MANSLLTNSLVTVCISYFSFILIQAILQKLEHALIAKQSERRIYSTSFVYFSLIYLLNNSYVLVINSMFLVFLTSVASKLHFNFNLLMIRRLGILMHMMYSPFGKRQRYKLSRYCFNFCY